MNHDLFVELDVMGHDLFELANCYNRAAFYNPCGGVVLGSNGLGSLEGFPAAIGQLRRHAASMRQIYSGLAVEWITRNHPGADQHRIHVRRLAELGLSAAPPDDEEECIKFMESDEETAIDDDVSPWMLDGLKRREEDLERARRRTEVEKAAIVARALAAGIGTPETVSQTIYEMGVEEFLNLTEGFPSLSRVDFKKRNA